MQLDGNERQRNVGVCLCLSCATLRGHKQQNFRYAVFLDTQSEKLCIHDFRRMLGETADYRMTLWEQKNRAILNANFTAHEIFD